MEDSVDLSEMSWSMQLVESLSLILHLYPTNASRDDAYDRLVAGFDYHAGLGVKEFKDCWRKLTMAYIAVQMAVVPG